GPPVPPQPGAGDGRAGADGVVLPQPHCALSRPSMVPDLVVDPVRRLARHDALVEPAEPPRRFGLQVESGRFRDGIVEAERTRTVERVLPVVTGHRGLYGGERFVGERRRLALPRTHGAGRYVNALR